MIWINVVKHITNKVFNKKIKVKGARFTKWRASFDVNQEQPSQLAIDEQCSFLARYAAVCQANGLVPIVEPEVLVLEGDHDINFSYNVTEKILQRTFEFLYEHKVVLEYMILKPNFVLAGKKCSTQPSAEEIASLTLKCFKRTVPSAVPGIFFLSGGLSEKQSQIYLNEINKKKNLPWVVSFSYGRALQSSCLKTWKGDKNNVEEAQKVYLEISSLCSKSAKGEL
jgi:fructose-bisphosphate aldolase, class I